MSKPRFEHWRTLVDSLRKPLSLSKGYLQAEGEMLERLAKDPALRGVRDALSSDIATMSQFRSEHNWNVWGCPYYKVWPQMAEMLCETSIDIPSTSLHFPFQTFAILLPENEKMKSLGRSLLITAASRDVLLGEDSLDASWKNIERIHRVEKERCERVSWQVTALYRMPVDSPDVVTLSCIECFESESVEAALQRMIVSSTDDWEGRIAPDVELSRLFRTVIAVSFFATDRHEVICPDIPVELIEKRYKGGRSKGSRQIADERRSRVVAKVKGWRVGSEIDLPRPDVLASGARRGEGHELTCSHARSGHMRMQPCGPGGKDRKLIFIAPTIVRPDLPVRAMHGYRLHDKVLRRNATTKT